MSIIIPASKGVDISGDVFGRYVTGFICMGMEYSDLDESYASSGLPKYGAVPSPRHTDRRPWRGRLVEWWRTRNGPRK